MPSGLRRCKCYASNVARHLLNEINTLVFRTNTLILKISLQTAMNSNLVWLYELQGLARTSPQGALGMDEPRHNKTEICDEHGLHFH